MTKNDDERTRLDLGAGNVGKISLHCTLLKTAKLRTGISSQSGADFFQESVWEKFQSLLYDPKGSRKYSLHNCRVDRQWGDNA